MITLDEILEEGWEITEIEMEGGWKRKGITVNDIWVSFEDIADAGYQNIHILNDLSVNKGEKDV